jgi:hypothetical protein
VMVMVMVMIFLKLKSILKEKILEVSELIHSVTQTLCLPERRVSEVL